MDVAIGLIVFFIEIILIIVSSKLDDVKDKLDHIGYVSEDVKDKMGKIESILEDINAKLGEKEED